MSPITILFVGTCVTMTLCTLCTLQYMTIEYTRMLSTPVFCHLSSWTEVALLHVYVYVGS
eukprot:m.543272 g.543272  ORF g.543272 m.543272 type:complete len:60 (+) comp22126_c0_seq2:3-182(+)